MVTKVVVLVGKSGPLRGWPTYGVFNLLSTSTYMNATHTMHAAPTTQNNTYRRTAVQLVIVITVLHKREKDQTWVDGTVPKSFWNKPGCTDRGQKSQHHPCHYLRVLPEGQEGRIALVLRRPYSTIICPVTYMYKTT